MRTIKIFFSFKQWSLQARVSALVVIPLLCISILTSFTINSALTREQASLYERAEKLVLLAADAAQLALFAGDSASLNNLSAAIIRDSQISELLFYDENIQPINPSSNSLGAGMAKGSFIDGRHYIDGDHRFFIKSVYAELGSFDEDPERFEATVDAELIGWVVLVVNLNESTAYQADVIRSNLLVALFMIVIALWLAFRFSRTIVQPINNITQAVVRYGTEDFSRRVEEVSAGELGMLEKGINNLADRVGQSQLILKDEVEKATTQWAKAANDLELQNIGLAEAKETAESANAAKDDFLARMSHELRTPLTAIMGFVGLLTKTDQPALRQEYTEMISTSSSVLLSTINDILDFSKLRANSFVLNPVRFNLEDCVRETLDLHRISAFNKDIELNVLIDSDVPEMVFADIDKFKKILNNIISNAVKFTPSGDIVVFVSLLYHQAEQAELHLLIKDSGIGISKNDLDKIFNPFVQCDETSSRRHEGTGLGLSIAEDFTLLMGGNISIESEVGEGTEVGFSVCCRTDVSGPVSDTTFAHLQPVLFDENPWTRRSWRNQLLKYSDHVIAPGSFSQLLKTLQLNEDVDVLLLGFNCHDQQLTDAEALLASVRLEFSGVIILAVAELKELGLQSLAAQYGPLQVVSKPMTNNRLQAALTQTVADFSMPVDNGSAAKLSFDSPYVLQGLRLLLAEDNKFNQQLVASILTAAGAEVVLADNGFEAMRCCQAERFDTLVFDLHMPGLSGLQLSADIRSNNGCNTETAIVILTADVFTEMDSEMINAGIGGICFKPIVEADLIEKIRLLAVTTQRLSDNSDKPDKRSIIELKPEQLTEEVDVQLTLISQAIDSGEFTALKEQLHQLQGVIGLCGIALIDEALNDLNRAVVGADNALIKACFKHLSQLWSATSI